MSATKRIIAVSIVLVGSAVIFRFWSLGQFNGALDQMTAAVANSNTVTVAAIVAPPVPAAPVVAVASTSTSISTSTASTIIAISTTTTTSTDAQPTLTFIFPDNTSQLYNGCTYPVTWQSSTTVDTLGITLVDAGSQKNIGPANSGLAATTTVIATSSFPWKVSVTWPGKYYISIFGINGIDTKARSRIFHANAFPANTSHSDKQSFCQDSGGNLM
jgi:hypothetical protein